jgi:chromosome partitioning protein
MAIISFDSAKGGVGKTTLAVNVAAEFALRGIPTSILDCDLNQHASAFGQIFSAMNPDVPLKIIGGLNKATILRAIKTEASSSEMVIIDLPAGMSEMANRAMVMSHLVVIPAKKTTLDVRDAVRTALHVAEASEMSGRDIASVLMWTMVGSYFESSTERFVRHEMTKMLISPETAIAKIPLLWYDAFPSGFAYGFVPSQVSDNSGKSVKFGDNQIKIPASAKKAAQNVSSISDDILSRLGKISTGDDPGHVTLTKDVVDMYYQEASDSVTVAE